jgi:hypothetical protein
LSFHCADEEKKRAALASEDRIELKVYGIEAAGRGPFIYYVSTFLGFFGTLYLVVFVLKIRNCLTLLHTAVF